MLFRSEVVSFNFLVGSLDSSHLSEMNLLNDLYELNDPYSEFSLGIDNIFSAFRIDAIWRLAHKNNPNTIPFGLRASAHIGF